jgi:hypothetical protein
MRKTVEQIASKKPAVEPIEWTVPVAAPALDFTFALTSAGAYALADLTVGSLSPVDYQTLYAKADRWI